MHPVSYLVDVQLWLPWQALGSISASFDLLVIPEEIMTEVTNILKQQLKLTASTRILCMDLHR